MNLQDIISKTIKPKLYEKGTSVMWTDPHIARQLLNVHLNTEIDLASRKKKTIEKTVEWILKQTNKKHLNILDLGCGPGLYTELIAKKGHKVTGVDFSNHSIEYARNEAKKKNLNIEYIQANYLNLDLEENKYDLAIQIFTDFGVLQPNERDILLRSIKNVLKPEGVFIFDVLNDNNIESKLSPKNWEISESGFWKEEPYLALSESFLYKKQKLILNQHTIIDKSENIDIYRFWIHFFSHSDVSGILRKHNFSDICFYEDVLPGGNTWNGENVTFCKAVNKN
jgi:2-polyprenyl-3-methyl-5-hydroxy-6-metoxy-1,4-benzoquinol methylase